MVFIPQAYFNRMCIYLMYRVLGGWFSSHPDTDVDMDGPEAELVRKLIHDNCVVIFSKSNCPQSCVIRDTLKLINASYEVVELDGRNDGQNIQDVLGKLSGSSVVRQDLICWYKTTYTAKLLMESLCCDCTVTMWWQSSHLLAALVEDYKTVYLCHLDSYTVTVHNSYLVSSHVSYLLDKLRYLADRFLHRPPW